MESCTPLEHYDYFSGSERSFALTFLAAALCIPGKHIFDFLLWTRFGRDRKKEVNKVKFGKYGDAFHLPKIIFSVYKQPVFALIHKPCLYLGFSLVFRFDLVVCSCLVV